ncbi:MAG: tyrosine-type recombinase/integrase [Clostridia bacterium]|nr:tyrosine-type recombinase/integrase [Clostridia bacterium]
MNEKVLTQEMIGGFRDNLVLEERSAATIEKYTRDAKRFCDYAGGKCITKELVIAYKEDLRLLGYAVRSINSMLASINSLFRYLDWNDIHVKSIKIQQQIFCSEEKELSKSEYFSLVKAACNRKDETMCLILQTICSTGIRVSELEFVTVEAVINGEAVVSCKGKIRTIFIVSELQKKLVDYCKKRGIKEGPVFLTKVGNPVNRSLIWHRMKGLCKVAKVNPSKVFPHNLRHLFARSFYNLDNDIAKLADVLGHSNINTTRIYIVSTGSEHRKKLEKMHLTL